jgi:formiminotetrahydrofolate cyclodeaminase
MTQSVWDLKLGEVRDRMIAGGPMPGGVALSTVVASLALGLVAMVLKVTAARRDFAGDRDRLDWLRQRASDEARRIGEYGDADIAAYEAYLAALRIPRDRADERRTAVRAALRRAIEVPMEAARAITGAIELCVEALPMVSRLVAPDLGAAAGMLGSAVRTILISVDYNVEQLSFDPDLQTEVVAQRRELEAMATLRSGEILQATAANDWWQAG